MKTIFRLSAMLMILVSSVCFVISTCSAQWTATLMTESFESGTGTTPPAGWAIEQVTGTIPGIDFVSASSNPSVSAACNGTKFVRYNSYNITSGSTRLKYTTALSTLNRNFILVDFNWFEDPSIATSNDKVEVQWSVDGSTWNTAGSFYRYNVVPGWKLKHQWLPAGANNQPALYVAFLFTSANGGNCSLDWMHVTGSSTTNGVVSGYVRDASTQMPVKWAVVSAGINRDTTTSDGFYAIYNLPAGAITMTAASQCYISGSATAIITTGTIAGKDFNLISAPAVAGIVTDGCSGAPVAGALITVAGSYQTMTGLDGTYLLTCITVLGTQSFMVSKTGYDSFTSMITLVVNTTTTVNANLLCTPVPPGSITTVLNDPLNPTSVNINWTAPQGSYQLIYDDGSQEGFSIWATAGNIHAVKFTPLGLPAQVIGGVVNVGTSGNYPPDALPLSQFTMFIYKADAPGGLPGTVIDSAFLTPTGYGWNNFSFTAPISFNSGDFYLVMKQGGIPPHACGIGIDTTASQHRSWSGLATGGGLWVPVDGNYMMRATMNGPGGPVLLDNTAVMPSYQVWRMLQGNEGNPAGWTSVYTGNSTSATDGQWTSLACGPYVWCVKAYYPPGQRPSPATFSNVIGKCWTSTVTVQATSACEVCGKNTVVTLTNVNYPDTNYLIPLDSLGHGELQGIWKGNYRLNYSQFGCQTVIQNNIPIFGDTTLTFSIAQDSPPVTNLSVNNLSLLATWNFPVLSYNLFSEDWSSGSFSTNQWMVSGGNNWQISNAIGNPAPSAMFNWTPQCTNCSQYLTSKILNTGNAPTVLLQYDIYLDNYSTTDMNTLAVEIWNGTTWSVARIYDNQGGSIPWTTEVVDISNLVSGDFKLRFQAAGTNTSGINNWNIDNIKITGRDSGYSPAACLLGYSVGLNNILSAFVTDTSYHIPPDQVIYGQPYQFCVTAVYSGGYSTQECKPFISQFLYPPDSLTVTPTECTAYLTWKKPDDPVAQSGLAGYNIFRNGVFIHFNDHPDSLSWYDLNLNPGNYLYGVTARYDLGVYGFPGQPGESLRLNDTEADTVHCGFPVPFNEAWNQGNFNFHNWTFEPEQGNWGIGNGLKTTDPCADFHWQPMRNNYSYALVSDNIDAFAWKCAGLWLDFDYKLVDRNATGNEKMRIEAWFDDEWHLLSTLSNNGSVDWTTIHLDLSAVSGKGFRIRFVAQGVNSADILHWYIDNIKVYGICRSPSGLAYSTNGLQVDLTWLAPVCNGMAEPAGYNVYRTDETGLPPFLLRNPFLVPGNTFSDNIGPVSGGIYSYYVTAIFDDPMMPEPLCESLASDTVVVSTVGIPGKPMKGISVFPNPANNTIQIKSDRNIVLVQILDYKGETFTILREPESTGIAIDVSGYPSGIYFFRVTDRVVTKIVKVVIIH